MKKKKNILQWLITASFVTYYLAILWAIISLLLSLFSREKFNWWSVKLFAIAFATMIGAGIIDSVIYHRKKK